MNVFNIEKAFKDKVARGWHTLYLMVDAHGTIVRPYHDKLAFYEGALEVLKWFSDRSDFKLILWTSSHDKEAAELCETLMEHGVEIDFVNENPLEKNSKLACFDQKFYFNIILDDKAGFEPEIDWVTIKTELQRIGEWKTEPMNETKTETKPAVKRRAIYIEKLPDDAQNWLGYGQTGFVTSEPVNNVVHFAADGGRDYLVDLKSLYFPSDFSS